MPKLYINKIRKSDFKINAFLKRSNLRAYYQIIVTIVPVIAFWFIVSQIISTNLPSITKGFLLFPNLFFLTLLSSRTFSLMHDCGHNSLFEKRSLNNIFGFFLGLLNGIPQKPWSNDHAFHHRNNGNWEIYKGPIDVLSLEDYRALNKSERFFYKISRHWIMLFPGGFFYLVIKPRLGLILVILNFIKSLFKESLMKIKDGKYYELLVIKTRIKPPFSDYGDNFDELFDLIANNILVISGWIFMCKWLGTFFFLTFYSLISTLSAAIFICIFFIQHNFENTYASSTKNWEILNGAITGSSNLDIPNWLNWFLADISFHSIHHLSERIPNYNLRACHNANIHLLHKAKVLRLIDIPKCFKYILWDSKKENLIPIN